MTIALVLLWSVSFAPFAWSKECGEEKNDKQLIGIGFALANPPIIDLEAQQLATAFVGHTLPNLLAEDPLLARHLGFTRAQDIQNFQESGARLETPLPLFIIKLKALRAFVRKETLPLALLATDVNWIEDSATDPRPTRLLFPIRLNKDASGDGSATRSSVLIEKPLHHPWRIHNAGGPTLLHAVKTYSTRKEDFLVWIPGINRHYLGRIGEDFRFKMTVLFDDPVARVYAGDEFDPCDSNVIEKLQKLDTLLQSQMPTQVMDDPNAVKPRGTYKR
jgi:hypothetical protein